MEGRFPGDEVEIGPREDGETCEAEIECEDDGCHMEIEVAHVPGTPPVLEVAEGSG